MSLQNSKDVMLLQVRKNNQQSNRNRLPLKLYPCCNHRMREITSNFRFRIEKNPWRMCKATKSEIPKHTSVGYLNIKCSQNLLLFQRSSSPFRCWLKMMEMTCRDVSASLCVAGCSIPLTRKSTIRESRIERDSQELESAELGYHMCSKDAHYHEIGHKRCEEVVGRCYQGLQLRCWVRNSVI